MYVYIYMYVCVCVYIQYMYVYIYIYTYIYTILKVDGGLSDRVPRSLMLTPPKVTNQFVDGLVVGVQVLTLSNSKPGFCSDKTDYTHVGRFPALGVPPIIIHFRLGFSRSQKASSYGGTEICSNPHVKELWARTLPVVKPISSTWTYPLLICPTIAS